MNIAVRSLIIIVLILGSLYLGWSTYTTVYELLDFQVTLYKWFLHAQSQTQEVKVFAGEVADKARELFGQEVAKITDQDSVDIETRLDAFSARLKLISGTIGTIIALASFKIAFDIVFDIKRYVKDIRNFIIE